MSERKIAKEDLYVGETRRYKAGDSVSVSWAKARGLEDKLVGENTKTAAKLRGEDPDDEKTTDTKKESATKDKKVAGNEGGILSAHQAGAADEGPNAVTK